MKNQVIPQFYLSFPVSTKSCLKKIFKKTIAILIFISLTFSGYSHEKDFPISNGIIRTYIEFIFKKSKINDSLITKPKQKKSNTWNGSIYSNSRTRYFTKKAKKTDKKSENYPFDLIIVPGYTPRNGVNLSLTEKNKRTKKGKSKHLKIEGRKDGKQSAEENPCYLHGDAIMRLQIAVVDYVNGKAPLIIVSGGNVWPKETQCYEAIMMKNMLIKMGIPEDKIIVDDKARHSTTNLRNVGRYMLEHGMKKALVTTSPGQDFYFSHPLISSFTVRSISQLGLKIGKLRNPKKKEWWFKVVGELEANKTAVLLTQRAGIHRRVNHSVFEPKETVFIKGSDPFDL